MPPCFVILGGAGDVMNVLPLAHDRASRGDRPAVMIARQYADMMDGVSYCDRVTWWGGLEQSEAAADWARTHFSEVLEPRMKAGEHMSGPNFAVNHWLRCGVDGAKWGQSPVLFDRRNAERESALIALFPQDRPWIILSTSGVSSPIRDGRAVFNALGKAFWKSHHVIDISNLQAVRIYDLLGLMERADVLVLNDSAPLHLSSAVKAPVVALLSNPYEWGTTPAYPNHAARLRYPAPHEQIVWTVAKVLANRVAKPN